MLMRHYVFFLPEIQRNWLNFDGAPVGSQKAQYFIS